MLDSLLRDFHYGLRQIRRNPGFAATAMLTLALGIGVNTAIFSYADALLYRPLEVHEPHRLVTLFHATQEGSHSSFSFPDYEELRDQNQVFSGLAAYSEIEVSAGEADSPQLLLGAIVSGNYFDVLGVEALQGRFFRPEEDKTEGTHLVAVISHELWQSRFQSDAQAVGQDLLINGRAVTIVGVAPAGFRGTELYSTPDLWVPLMMHRVVMPSFRILGTELFGNRGTHWLSLVGRLRPDSSIGQAQSNLESIARRQAELYPETNREWTILTVPSNNARLGSPTGGRTADVTKLLLAVAALVLLIACANVANLFLAKSSSRQREMGIRLALGAGGKRLLRQLLTESMTLSLLGGMLGLLLAGWTASLLYQSEILALIPGLEIRLDVRAFLFALALAGLAGSLFGLILAFKASRREMATTLRSVRDASSEPGRMLGNRLLVAAQVAFCLIALVGAGLILRTLYNLQHIELGFDPQHLLLVSLDTDSDPASPQDPRQAHYAALLDEIRSLAGVEQASMAYSTPFGSKRAANDFFLASGERFNVDMNVVGTGYFRTLGVRLLRGRGFEPWDRQGTPGVVVVNQALAQRYWPGQEAVGQQLRMWDPNGPGKMVEVIGVVADGRYYRGWKDSKLPFLFLPFSQLPLGDMTFHVRAKPNSPSLAAELRRLVAQSGHGLSVDRVQPVEEARSSAMTLERMGARLLSAFAVLALALSAIGIYGVVSFSVTRRRHEIGVRMALGAGQKQILRLLTLRNSLPLLLGTGAGWAGALALARLAESSLFGLAGTDFPTYAIVTALVLAVGLLAGYIPARRAASLDPLLAIRQD